MPIWSPSGNAVAVVLQEIREHYRDTLLIVDIHDSHLRAVFKVPAWNIYSGLGRPGPFGMIYGEPAWSPDGQTLAFLYYRNDYYPRLGEAPPHPDGFPGVNPMWRLVRADLSDGSLGSISLGTNFHWNSPHLSWSPDSKRILLTRYSRYEGIGNTSPLMDPINFFPRHPDHRNIVALNVETGHVQVISQGSYAARSPDGNRIAIVGAVDGNGGHLATLASDGTDFHILVKTEEAGDLELAK